MSQSKPLRHGLMTVVVLAISSIGAASSAMAQEDSASIVAKGIRCIAITATDRVTHHAEIATVHIGYDLYSPNRSAAYAAASKASNAIIDALRAAGIPGDAIESQEQSITPVDPFERDQLSNSEHASHAFIAQQSWTVRTAVDDAARVLDLAIKAGANKSGEVDWSLKDQNAASAEAAALALQHAKAQALAMANGLGVHLGQLLYASNQVQAEPISPILAGSLQNMAREKTPPLPLALNRQQIETSATVYAVFAIE